MYANDPTTMLAGIMGQRGLAANIYEPSQSWMDFGGKVTGTLAGEEYALKQLATVLPYVDSQKQLASVIARYKEDVWRAGVGGSGEFGAGTGPFDVPGLPGATGTAHEWGQTANFDPYTTQIQNAVNALVGQLPATGGRDALSLANQMFRQRTAAATPFGAGAYPGQLFVRFPDGSFGAQTLAEYEANPMPVAENIWAGDPRYNYAAQGIPDPNWNPGAMSSAWQQMMNPGMNMQPRSDTLPPELLAQLSSLLMPTPTASNSTSPFVLLAAAVVHQARMDQAHRCSSNCKKWVQCQRATISARLFLTALRTSDPAWGGVWLDWLQYAAVRASLTPQTNHRRRLSRVSKLRM